MSEPYVEPSLEAAATRLATGGGGLVVGPVVFGGVRFWASVEPDLAEVARRREDGVGALVDSAALRAHLANDRPAAVRLLGCLVREYDAAQALRQASLLAGYAPRSVLIDETDDVLGVMVDASLLDQGVIVRRSSGQLEVVAGPGPRVHGSGLDARELGLLETVYGAWLAASSADELLSDTVEVTAKH